MAGPPNPVRRGLGRVQGRVVRPFADASASRSADHILPRLDDLERRLVELAGAVEGLAGAVAAVQRLLGEQGDVAGEALDLNGRATMRLSAEVEALHEELTGLRARIDHLGGAGSRR